MKKLLLLLLIAPVLGFGQVLTDVFYREIFNQVNDPREYDIDNYNSKVTVLEVPTDKLWKIVHMSHRDTYNLANDSGIGFASRYYIDYRANRIVYVGETNNNSVDEGKPLQYNSLQYSSISSANQPAGMFAINDIDKIHFIPSGTKFTFSGDYYSTANHFYTRLLIYEYSFDNNSLSSNYPETIQNNSNTPVLFPNPTSSLLALNSDKEYDIEVYDMAGNKLMALTGNSINMEHLSTATYIVKATDKSNNEELTYKVVKN